MSFELIVYFIWNMMAVIGIILTVLVLKFYYSDIDVNIKTKVDKVFEFEAGKHYKYTMNISEKKFEEVK